MGHVSGSNHTRLQVDKRKLRRLYAISKRMNGYPQPVWVRREGTAQEHLYRLYAHGRRHNSRVCTIKTIATRKVRRNSKPTRSKSGYRRLYDVKWELD